MTSNELDLERLRQSHAAYMANWKRIGGNFHEYKTPCCGTTVETTAPSEEATWDSLVTCSLCGELYFKVVTKEAVTVKIP